MEKFTFELLFQIIGIGSASGLVYKDNTLLLIGDNSEFLYEYILNSGVLKQHPLTEHPLENIPKKDKPDFESITSFANSLYVLGSGSTEKRNKMVQIDAKTKQIITTTDLTDLYLMIQSFGKIKSEDFNIEGAIYYGTSWLLFNRGNGTTNKNVIFTIQRKNLTNEFNILSNAYKLPQINGVRTSFTDAILVDDKIYFLATAEDTTSTYEDGEVLGSIIGRIDVQTMKIDFTRKISDEHKFEGLTLFENSNSEITFFLCEDQDTDELKSNIYKLTLKKANSRKESSTVQIY
ncbi:DUF6929 family protein [Flavobacterium psychrotolerans]|uniref:Apyrase n=1 Tax=Flavobacterium psychrotolerans TaxID=2169410 RepID=A0A2U1JQK9_9FLAO|nr:hypothetical protein [Flavobacterium psychrotolerans]PWA07264.1 hypothetical protein DB895_00640 [Flavobacterium psychrotolerans]